MSSPSLRFAFLCIMAALLTSPGAFAEPVGVVDVDVEPDEATIVGTGEVTLTVQVTAELTCARGFEAPGSIIGFPTLDEQVEDLPEWHVTPQELALDWQPVEGEDHVYRVDRTETITVRVDEAVETPETHVLDFIVPSAEGRSPGKVCSAEGYSLTGDSDTAALYFEPEPSAASDGSVTMADESAGFARMQMLPLVLAIGLVAVLAVFASLRNRNRDA